MVWFKDKKKIGHLVCKERYSNCSLIPWIVGIEDMETRGSEDGLEKVSRGDFQTMELAKNLDICVRCWGEKSE